MSGGQGTSPTRAARHQGTAHQHKPLGADSHRSLQPGAGPSQGSWSSNPHAAAEAGFVPDPARANPYSHRGRGAQSEAAQRQAQRANESMGRMVAAQASALSQRQGKPSGTCGGTGMLDRYLDFRANVSSVAAKGLPLGKGFSSHRGQRPADSAHARPPSARHSGGMAATSRDLPPGMGEPMPGMGEPMPGMGGPQRLAATCHDLPQPLAGGPVPHPGPQPTTPAGTGDGTAGAGQRLRRGDSWSQRATAALGLGKQGGGASQRGSGGGCGGASHRSGSGSHRSTEGGQSTARRLLGRITGGGSARKLPSVLADSHRPAGTRDRNVRV